MASAFVYPAVGLAVTAASYPFISKLDASIEGRKRKLSLVGEAPPSKRLRISQNRNMAFRSRRGRTRFRRRRRFVRRSRFRKRVPFRKRRFTKAVRRVIRRTAEPKKQDNPDQATIALRGSDGTSRVTYLRNIPASLAQGLEDDQFVGNSFYFKGFNFRGQVALSQFSANRNGAILRVSHVYSRQQVTVGAGTLGTGFLEMNSGTTSALTQTAGVAVAAPESMPRLFEAIGTPGFVGNFNVIPFDRTNCKVIRTYYITVNPSGNVGDEVNTTIPTPFDLYFPVNKTMQIVDPTEASLAAGTNFKWGTHYLVIQAIADTNAENNVTTSIAELDYRISIYFRDP